MKWAFGLTYQITVEGESAQIYPFNTFSPTKQHIYHCLIIISLFVIQVLDCMSATLRKYTITHKAQSLGRFNLDCRSDR